MQEPENYKLYSYTADHSGNDNENNEEEADHEKDTDNDNVPDYIEDIFGLDKTKEDTDSDNLSDWFELRSMILDPLKADSDGNGINDEDEDADNDGLSNLEEYHAETNPLYGDTDNDGLKDGEEIHKYKTNPVKADTDGDGASDGKETELGTDPLVADKTFNISMESDDEDTVKASVSIGLSGEQIDTLCVEKVESDFLFPENMPGYIGSAYDFTVEGDFESAIINFEFDEALLSNPEFAPVIYYFNEEEQELEELETTVTGNLASARVEHFSKYILINRTEHKKYFGWQDVFENGEYGESKYKSIEVVFVKENTDSNENADKNNQINEFEQYLKDALPKNSIYSLILVEDAGIYLSEKVTKYRDNYTEICNSSLYALRRSFTVHTGIGIAITRLKSVDDNVLKIIIVLNDGENNVSVDEYEAVISRAKENNIRIHTVEFSDNAASYDKKLELISEKTGGRFYHISDTENITEIYSDAKKNEDIETDSDGDGIPDYYEDNLPMFNGLTVKLDKNNPDSDDDGLDDGEEVKLIYEYNDDRTQVKVTGKFLSNPKAEDTDGDGLSDIDELYVYDTYALFADSDKDGLDDGTEVENWFDPREKDYDKDGRFDLEEYEEGTSPYVYDINWGEFIWDFGWGVFLGDIIHDTDSLPCILGQITGSCIPLVDIRDFLANIYYGDYSQAGLSLAGLVPIGGDAVKATNKIGKFALKNADDIGIYAEILSFSNKNFPDAVKQLGKNDEFVLATKKVSELSEKKITKKQYQEMLKSWTQAGIEELLGSTSTTDKRIYKPSPKHDPISGWGSPDPIPDIETGQKLLDTAYSSLKNKQLYNIYNNQLIKFQPDSVDGWHAYLVENPAKEVPADVLRKMLEDKKITKVQYKDFIKNSKR